MTSLTLEVISKAIFRRWCGVQAKIVGEQITLLNQFTIEKLNQPFRLPALFPTPFNVRERKAVKLLDSIIYEIIENRKKRRRFA